MSKVVTYAEIDVPEFSDTARAAEFDGTNDYLTRGAGLTGAADSQMCTVSFWVRTLGSTFFDTVMSTSTTAAGATTRSRIEFNGSGGDPKPIIFYGRNSAGTDFLQLASANPIPSGEWTHVMMSVDASDPAKVHLYVDGVSDLNVILSSSDTMDFTLGDWSIGGAPSGVQKLTGDLADVWIAPGVYIDLSVAANRRKFISDLNGPVDLGATGATPTGTAPLMFFSGAVAAWHTNKGTGGGFTLHGALVDPGPVTETFRFAMPAAYLDDSIEAIPSIENVSFSPATISLGENLGQRASLNISMNDHLHIFNGEPYEQGTFWGKWRGRYGTKLRGCPVRLIRGEVGQAIANMDTRHYVVDTTEGPSFSAMYTITGKDILKLADDDRAQAPALSNGSLAGSISAVAVSATMNPAGIGNLEYPASGWVCIAGKEVCSFTRVADVLTIVRAQFGTVATTHDAGDRVQLVLRYTGNDPADIIQDLLVNYAGVPSSYITIADWQLETSSYLNVIYAATITEPTSVNKLVSEIIEQAALAVWWDDRAKQVRLQVLREIATDVDTFTADRMLEGSFSVKEQPTKRISQIWTYYGQRDPTDSGANEDGYRAALATVDLALEAEYGSAEIRKIQARWVETLTAATRLNSIQISRFRDPPRAFGWSLPRDETVTLAGGYQLTWWGNQDAEGNEVPALVQVTRITIQPDRMMIEAEEMLASGTTVLVNVVFLTLGGGPRSFTVPASWNDSDNTIELIAGGGGGATVTSSGAKGGGGGAYSAISNLNLTPGASLTYQVGDGGAHDANGGDSWFNGASFAASSVAAKGGIAGNGRNNNGEGGLASGGIGTTKTSGGNGGNGAGGTGGEGGGGGGGAGGPHGNGAVGGGASGSDGAGGGGADGGSVGDSDGAGGNNRFGFGGGTDSPGPHVPGGNGQEGGGGGGGQDDNGGTGGAGEQLWTQTVAPITSAGPGGGGGGGGDEGLGGDGGLYGGGGGGGGKLNTGLAFGGDGGQGIIVITWRE